MNVCVWGCIQLPAPLEWMVPTNQVFVTESSSSKEPVTKLCLCFSRLDGKQLSLAEGNVCLSPRRSISIPLCSPSFAPPALLPTYTPLSSPPSLALIFVSRRSRYGAAEDLSDSVKLLYVPCSVSNWFRA